MINVKSLSKGDNSYIVNVQSVRSIFSVDSGYHLTVDQKVKKISEYDQEIPQSHTADQTHCTARKSHRTLTVRRHQEDN